MPQGTRPVDGQQPTADPKPDEEALDAEPGDVSLAESSAESSGAADDAGHAGDGASDGADDGDGSSAADASGGDEAAGAGGDAASGGDAGSAGERADRPRKPRREKPRRDPHEPTFGGVFLDTLQRLAGLRGQFAYGVPEKLWRANREQTIRILREEVPMPTFKNQIHCILNSDPEWLAHDVHYEMLSSATPPEDSFRWLWLYMMLR